MNERFTLVGGGRELRSCLVVQKSDCRKPDTILFILSNEGLVYLAIGAILSSLTYGSGKGMGTDSEPQQNSMERD